MTKRPNLFAHSSTSLLFGEVGPQGEIDLRAEFDAIVFGIGDKPRKGWPLIVRRMRRDSAGEKIACVCREKFSGEADPDCSYCLGEGYLWDEGWVMGRSQYVGTEGGLGSRYRKPPPGEVRTDTKLFFLRYDANVKYGDKIIEAKLDQEGNVVVPLVRRAIYKPQTINEQRSDNGRIEFLAIFCLENDAIRPDELQ